MEYILSNIWKNSKRNYFSHLKKGNYHHDNTHHTKFKFCKGQFYQKSTYTDNTNEYRRKHLEKIVQKYEEYGMISSGIIMTLLICQFIKLVGSSNSKMCFTCIIRMVNEITRSFLQSVTHLQ